MLVLKVFAAFWAAENTEEKKPEEAACGPVSPAGVGEEDSGVCGGSVVLTSLLGPAPPAVPFWSLRWADWTSAGDEAADSLLAALGLSVPVVCLGPEIPGLVLAWYVGVGGVLTMVGPDSDLEGV